MGLSFVEEGVGRVEKVFSVPELDDFLGEVADGAVVFDLDVLGQFDHASLDVPRGGGFHGSVGDPLSPRHGVEKEFSGRESVNERGPDEPSGFVEKIIAIEFVRMEGVVGESAGEIGEHRLDPLAVQVLLSQETCDLGDVEVIPLGPRFDACEEPVVGGERFLGDGHPGISCVREGV